MEPCSMGAGWDPNPPRQHTAFRGLGSSGTDAHQEAPPRALSQQRGRSSVAHEALLAPDH